MKAALLLGALLLALILIALSSAGVEPEAAEDSLSLYRERLEKELAELCSSVEGAGECRVFITFSEGESYEYQGGQIKATHPPKVLGVTVLCEGGGRTAVKARISELVGALFDVGANRICILKLS